MTLFGDDDVPTSVGDGEFPTNKLFVRKREYPQNSSLAMKVRDLEIQVQPPLWVTGHLRVKCGQD